MVYPSFLFKGAGAIFLLACGISCGSGDGTPSGISADINSSAAGAGTSSPDTVIPYSSAGAAPTSDAGVAYSSSPGVIPDTDSVPGPASSAARFSSSALLSSSSAAPVFSSSAIRSSSAAQSSSAIRSSSAAQSSSAIRSSSAVQSSSAIRSSSAVQSSSAIRSSSSAASSSSLYIGYRDGDYILGADISRFQEYESYGTKIYDTDGTEASIFTILANHGFNYIRLKTFVSPAAAYGYAAGGCGADAESFGDKNHVIAYAKKVQAAGFGFLLDIHYIDNCAYPNSQIIPSRWRNASTSDALADSVYAYTYDLISSLKSAGALPDMVQIGNEITNGLLRDLPTSSTNCYADNVTLAGAAVSGTLSTDAGKINAGKYLKAGVKAVKAGSPSIKTVMHIESLGNQYTPAWWLGVVHDKLGVNFDVMAFSAYTAYGDGTPSDWSAQFSTLSNTYTDLKWLIAEYNGGAAKNTYAYDNSRAQTNIIMKNLKTGLGAFIWEPASYGEWGAAMFTWNGNSLYANEKDFKEYDDNLASLGRTGKYPGPGLPRPQKQPRHK